MRQYISIFLVGILSISCSQNSNPLDEIIGSDHKLSELATDPSYGVQILYTQVDRDSLDNPVLNSYGFHVDDEEYFYPASTVKFPAVLIALEKMRELGIPSDARMEIDSAYSRQSEVRIDETASNLEPSVAHYSKKIMLVSDNDAYNRLYEFIGQDAFNTILQERGYTNTRFTHRLSISRTADENAHTNPMRFFDGDQLVYEQPLIKAEGDYTSSEPILRGEGYISNSELVEEPFDFTAKNFFSVSDQHLMMKAFIYPDAFPENAFDITPEDRDLVLEYMSVLPKHSGIEAYSDTTKYWDSYAKFLMYGSEIDAKIPSNIKIYNKIGLAYGFTIDNAYITDTENDIEFFLTTVIHTNPNKIFNDGVYDYETVAFPFMRDLGQAIYNYELNRN
jgi:hypothetical protein